MALVATLCHGFAVQRFRQQALTLPHSTPTKYRYLGNTSYIRAETSADGSFCDNLDAKSKHACQSSRIICCASHIDSVAIGHKSTPCQRERSEGCLNRSQTPHLTSRSRTNQSRSTGTMGEGQGGKEGAMSKAATEEIIIKQHFGDEVEF